MARGNDNRGGGRRQGGGGGGRRDRSPDDRDRERRNNSRNNDDQPSSSSQQQASQQQQPPDYHFHVRRAVRACVEDNDFQKSLLPEGTKIEVEEVLEKMCDACDAVAQALPTDDPVNFEALATSVKAIVTSHPKAAGNTAAANRFAVVFIQRVRQFLTKVEPPPPTRNQQRQQQQQQRNNSDSARNNNNTNRSDRDNDGDGPSEKRTRTEGRRDGNAINNDSNANNNRRADNNNKQQPPPVGGILGDAPLTRPSGGGSLFSAPPGYSQDSSRGVLDGYPPMYPPNNNYNNGNYNSNAGIMGTYPIAVNTHHNHNFQHHQQPLGGGTNAFAAFKPAEDVSTRYVTLRGLPEHMATREALKQALESIIHGMKNIPVNTFFLNYETFCNPPVNEGNAPSYYAVVSFNSFAAASEVVARINKMGEADGSPVTAEGTSDPEEIAAFWGETRDKLQELEMELLHQFAAIDAAKATAATIEARVVAIAVESADEDVIIKEIGTPSDAEQRERLKDALRKRVALAKELADLIVQRKANNASVGLAEDSTELNVPDRFSSSSAQPTNNRHLLYITDIQSPLADNKVLLLLDRLEIQAKHIWRDEGKICVEVPVFGAVVGALRKLDFLDFTFANMNFTNERPKKV